MMFKIAFRSIFRNARRSLTTALTIAVGMAAMLVFAAYALYDVYILQTAAVERGGHLTENIELKLVYRTITDAHWCGVFVPGQPASGPLDKFAIAV